MTTDTNVDINDLSVEIDVKETEMLLNKMLAVEDELKTQFPLCIFNDCGILKFIPTPECRMSGDEFGKQLIAEFLRIFDSACINECLKTIKTRVLTDKTFSH